MPNVDRVEFVAKPAFDGAAFYGLDDLTFQLRDGAGPAQRVVLDFEDSSWGATLTGSGYRGLVWERGTGDFDQAGAGEPPVEEVKPPSRPPASREREPDEADAPGAFLGGAGSLPALGFDFDGPALFDPGANVIPPDTCGAAGPTQFVSIVNRRLAIYDKANGALLMGTPLANFFPGPPPHGDPRALFDHHSGRWILIASDFNAGIHFAISTTDDATGTWFKTYIIVSLDVDALRIPDYPTLGVDADGIYVSAFMFGSTSRNSIFAIEKAPLLSSTPSLGVVSAWRDLPITTIQPCLTYGNPPGQYLVNRTNGTTMRIRRVDGPLTSPTLVSVGSVSVPLNGQPPDAPALGSTVDINTLGTRLMNAVYRNGSIWTTNTLVRATRSAVRWYEIDPVSLTTKQVGVIRDPELHYYYPSISVNSVGDVALGFSASSANQFVGAYYTGRLYTDADGETAVPVPFKAGEGAYNRTDANGQNRWGDYSLTSVDPADDLSFWTTQEYAGTNNTWRTRVARLDVPEPLGTAFCSPAVANSTGSPGELSVRGSAVVSDDDLLLTAHELPREPNTGYFLMGLGNNVVVLPGASGPMCISPGFLRILPPASNTGELDGGFARAVGTSGPVTGAITAGSTWNFQAWYRDERFVTSNFTDAVAVTFQ